MLDKITEWARIKSNLTATLLYQRKDLRILIDKLNSKDSFINLIKYCILNYKDRELNRLFFYNYTLKDIFLTEFSDIENNKFYKVLDLDTPYYHNASEYNLRLPYPNSFVTVIKDFNKISESLEQKHLVYEVTGELFIKLELDRYIVYNPKFRLIDSSGSYLKNESDRLELGLDMESADFINKVLYELENEGIVDDLASCGGVINDTNISLINSLDKVKRLLKAYYIIIDSCTFVSIIEHCCYSKVLWESMFVNKKPYLKLYRGIFTGLYHNCSSNVEFMNNYVNDSKLYSSSSYDYNTAKSFSKGGTCLPYLSSVVFEVEGDSYLVIENDIRTPNENEVVVKNLRIKSICELNVIVNKGLGELVFDIN